MIEKQTSALLTVDKKCVYKDVPHMFNFFLEFFFLSLYRFALLF